MLQTRLRICRGSRVKGRTGQRSRASMYCQAVASQDGGSSAPAEVGKVAVLGLGLMGSRIAKRVASQGFEVVGWNRNADKGRAGLEGSPVQFHDSAADAIAAAGTVITMLADADAITATLTGGDKGGAMLPVLSGKLVVQMGTIGPNESQSIAEKVHAAGGTYIEAPVLGSLPEVDKGTLLVMVGAKRDPSSTPVWALLKTLGQSPTYIGAVGTAAATKLALNQLIASLTVGFSTSLSLVRRSGAPVDKFMDILRGSALYAPTYDKKLEKMLSGDFGAANFPTKHLLKDVRLFEREASAAGIDTRLLSALKQALSDACDRGLSEQDYSSVADVVLNPNGDPNALGSSDPMI